MTDSVALVVTAIKEVRILKDVRLVYINDLLPETSSENARVQFELSGELQGTITCFLCLDGHELCGAEKNYLLPLFVESMNILIGRQLSTDPNLAAFKFKLSTPKFSLISKETTFSHKNNAQLYELELEESYFNIMILYAFKCWN